MTTFLFFLIVLAAVAYRAMTPEDRARTARKWLTFLKDAKAAIEKRRREPDAFRDAMRARTPWVITVPAFLGVSGAVFIGMLFGAGSFGDPETLIAWGGSFGPKTTNGEWWRVITSLFVHAGFFHLMINGLMLLQLGLLIERLMGRMAVAAVFAASGTFSNLARLSADPVLVHTGEAGAIFGLFGLLLASCVWGVFHQSAASVPWRNLRRLMPMTSIFLLYNGVSNGADTTGFVVGFGCGVLLARGIAVDKPGTRPVAMTAAASAILAVLAAVPIRGVTDVRPELTALVALEQRTAAEYADARTRFTKGRLSREKLIELIDKTIVPELEKSASRLNQLEGVPGVHQPLVDRANEFLAVRLESWRLRSTGLRKTDMLALRKADARARDSEGVLAKLKAADPALAASSTTPAP